MIVKASLWIYEAPKSLSLSAIQGQLEPYTPHEDGGSMAPSETSIHRDPSAEKQESESKILKATYVVGAEGYLANLCKPEDQEGLWHT